MTVSRFLLVLLLATGCTPASTALSDAGRKAVADEVRAANGALVDALNAHDADGVLALYETGPQFQYVGCTSVIPTSDVFGSITRGYLRQHPDVTYGMVVTALEVLDRDVAVSTLQGESDSLQLFTTRVWRRGEDGSWKVAYEHESWPGCKAPTMPHPGTAPGDTAGLEPAPIGG
ncbi:MAG TPA: nuclear transport factor 2 family protein [Longimicrobiales bacterium]|nr:nuclear transport factor 2 family protein [Longimicrobiales bacterium]